MQKKTVVACILGLSALFLASHSLAEVKASDSVEQSKNANQGPGQFTLSVELTDAEIASIRKEVQAVSPKYDDAIFQSAVKTYAQRKMRKALADTFGSMGYRVEMGPKSISDARDRFVVSSEANNGAHMQFTVPTQPDENVKLDKGFKVASSQNMAFSIDFVKKKNAKEPEAIKGELDVRKLQTRITETMRQFAPTVNIRFITD